ncbi:cobaltochelatase [Burkholderia contaminans]|uniref:cobaltochelatase CobT-related protein n=1 Tax=Burkholderia contaminans TaxID=488447 RepID=UPI001454546D|nr:cobalt chelatase [Burkholderia contaminans]VWD26366.1 cobaltochelatase [Burkholderia contaminans]
MSADRDAARRASAREALGASTVRALTRDAALHYRAGRVCRDLRPLPIHAPHLRAQAADGDLASWRGAADGAALRILHSDADLHRALSGDDPVERVLFDLLEQLRCESLAPPAMRGVVQNLRHRFETWSRAFHRSGQADTHVGILVYTVAQIAWSRLTGWPVLEETEDLIEASRAAIVPEIGMQLAGLKRCRHDQRAFAEHALALAKRIASMIRDARATAVEAETEDAREQDDALTNFSLWVDFDDTGIDLPALVETGDSVVLQGGDAVYRAYTTRYDRELRPAAQIRAALLREYRDRLDGQVAAQRINVTRLARVLRAALVVPQADGWSFGEEHGRLDGRRLAQLVSSPAERRLFRLERVRPHADCALAFLIDCSGSMKTWIDGVALMVDTLARAGDAAGLATEVLGFTTLAWNGGRARQDWLARGKPRHPGRLNETGHLVFKDADTRWRHARTGIAALYKADLFREGVDGEAVEWACARLAARPEARKILVVISDGSPMDGATALANDPFYLDNHLKQVVAREEAAGRVEVLGLGVGLDLGPYYRHRLAIDLGSAPDMKRLVEIAGWIGARR